MKYTIALSQWRLLQLSLQSNIRLLYKGMQTTLNDLASTVRGNKCNEQHDTWHYTNRACAALARYKNTNFVSTFKDWSIHDVGAMTAFISGLTFCWLQCAMSYKLKDHGVINSSAVCHSRAMLSLMITLCVAIFAAFQTKANLEWALARPRYHFLAKLKWGPQDPGYLFHVISSLAEWSMCGGMLLFMLTFTYEFQQIVITSDISSTEYWWQLGDNINFLMVLIKV